MRLPTTYFVFSPRLSRGVAAAFGFAVLVGMPLRGLSQQYLMGEEVSVTACGFYFLDDGGALHDASSSGDLTTTFCPETPGGELTFSFSTFSLAEGDTLFLWEGPDATGAPTYAFANDTLLGNDMGNGDAVTNPSGCLTWRFSPGAEGGSNWAALVSCSAPCNRPVVSATVNMAGTLQDSPVEACLGAVLAFDASGSVSGMGLEGSTWAWDFGDGTLSNAGSVVAHAYSDPGVYPVQLTLVDSAGCSSVNSLGWAVHVAAPISIDVPSLGPHVCAGGAAVLALGPDGVTTQSVASQPVASFGAGVMIPDSVGQAFSSEITFSGFPFGQSVSGVEDISGVLVNLEHSFILDLAIELECPNGSSMMLQGWPGGFGGCVDAGIPVTGDNPPDPGIGYDYSWSPGASEDWQSAALALLPSPTSGCASSTSPLPAGTYAATGDWSQLVGCPINGTWTMNILDTQEGDNGFLFGWSVDFAPDITPQQTVFEAAVGSGCDSMYWSPMEPWGFDMAEIGGCSSIVVEPTEAGSFGYVFTAVDAFGCSADTAVFITVEPGLDFAIGSNLLDPLSGVDPTLCAGLPLTLEATALSPVPPGTSFNWLLNGVGSGQLGTVYVDAAPDTGQQEILFQATTVAPPPIVGLCHFEWRDTIEVVVPPSVDLSVPDVCSNAPVLWEAPATGDGLGWSWLLSADNGDTLSQVTWAEPILGTQPPGAYTLEATVTDENGCADHAAATFEVFQAPDAGFSLDNVCAGEVLPFALNDSVGYAHPLTTASWSVVGGGALTDEGGHLGTSVTGGSGLPQITLDLVTVYPEGITCAATESQYAMVYSLPTMAIMGPDFACEGEDVAWWGVASVPFPGSVASSQWVLDGAMSLTQSGGDSLSLIGPPVGAYDLSLMAVSDQGCAATYSVDFDIVTMPSADFEWPATVCAGEEVEVSTTWPTGGTASHLWTANGTPMTVSGSTYPSSLTAAAGTVEVVHAVSIGGCSDTVTAVIEVSPLPVAGFAGPELACAGDAVVWSDNSVNPTVSPLTRTWAPLFAGPAPSSGVLYNFGVPGPGDYGMALTVTTAAGCSDSLTANLFVGERPDAAFALEPVCAGDSVPLDLSDPAGYPAASATWLWNGAPLTVPNTSSGIPSVLPPAFSATFGPQTAALSLALAHPGITCTSEHTETVAVFAQPTAAITAPSDFCAGPDADFASATVVDGGTPLTLDWSLDSGSGPLTLGDAPSVVLPSPAPGTYIATLTATTPDGCTSTAVDSVAVFAAADAAFVLPSQTCAGTLLEVDAEMSGLGVWTANGTPMTVSGSTYPSSLTAAAGTVEVVHAVSIGGCSDTVTAVIEVSPLPVAGFAGPELACAGDAVVWSDNSVNPTVSPLTRTWAPLFAGPAPSSGVLYNFGVPGPGDYGMALTVTTAAGCSDSLTANLFVGERPDAAFALEPVCAGDSVPLDLSDPAGYPAASATWLWNGAPLTVPNTSSGIPSVLPPAFSATFGPQTAALSLALAHPGITCTSEHTETVAVFAQPTAAITAPSDFCAGPDADFASATVVDGGTPLTLDWSLDSGSGPLTLGDAPSVVLPSPAPGTYIATLTATTPDGCTSTAVDSVAVFAAPQADFTLPTTVCAGGSVAVPSLVTPGVLEWSLNGQPLATDAGTFHAALTSTFGSQEVGVTVTLGEGADQCVDQHTEVLEVEAYPLVNFTGPLAACEGDVAMWQEACVHPQGLPMSMVWSVNSNAMTGTPDNALDLNGLPTGIHDIVLDVAGPAGCTASSQGTFEVHPVPEAAFSLSEACSGLPITWEDEASEGMFFGAPSWSWNGALLQVQSDTLPVVVSALAGNPTIVLQLTMEYATGVSCQALDSATTVVHETPDAVIDGPGHLCAGDTGHFIGSGGAAASPLVFEWSLDEATTEANSTPSLFDFTSVNTGLYNLSLEVLSAAGCASEANTDVEVVAAPDADFELPEGACTGEVLPLTLGTIPDNAAIIDSTWTWNGTPINPSAESMPLELTSSPGVQWVSLQLSVSAGTAVCVSQANQEVEVHAVPEVVWDLPEEGCSGLPMSITSVAQIEGAVPLISSWTWIQGGDSVQAFGDAFDAGMPNAGLYTVALEVEGAGGCVAQLEGDLTLHPTPNADFSAADVCAGTPMSVTWPEEGSWPDSMALWTWNGNATTVVGGHFDPMVSAVYGPQMLGVTLSTEFASGHVCSDTHMVTAEVWPQPALGWDAPNGMCAGDVAQFSSSSTVVAGGILSTEWLWGAPSGVLSASGEVASFGVPDSGQYDLEMVVNTAQGCADTLAASLEVYPLPNVQFSMDPVCEGTPILVEWDEADVAAETTYTWTWSGEDFELQNNTLPIEASMNEGVQVVQLTGWHEYSNGVVCSDGYEAAVAVLTTPQAAIAADTLWCEGEDVTVHEAVTGQGEWTCQWSSDVGSASGSEWQLPEGALGHIPATLTVINAAGCSDTLAFNVRIDPVPHLMLSDSLVMDCAPFSPELQADISGYAGAVLSTVWTWAGGQSESAAWSEEVDVGAWPVSCTVATGDADLQCTATSTASVVGLEVPVAQFSMYPEQPTTRQPNVELTAQGVPSGAALEWSVNGVPAGQSAVVDYTFAPYFGDDYTVCLVAMSSFGCADEWCREVEVIGEVQVYVPSGFTPDNDGVNDLFLPAVTPLEQVEDYRLEVYNRWGDLVFATQNPEEGWMGAYRSGSHFAGNEVFNWVITIDTQLGLPRRMAGQVTVIR